MCLRRSTLLFLYVIRTYRSVFVRGLLNLPKRLTPWVKFYFDLSLHIFSKDRHCLWKMCATPGACNNETRLFSSAAVVPQSIHWVSLPRCEARRRLFILTCDIFGNRQTNILALCYLFGKTYKPAHSSSVSQNQYSNTIHSTVACSRLSDSGEDATVKGTPQ